MRRKDWLLAFALIAAVFLVYQPAWNGGPIWDDDIHITPPELRSLGGLARIWTDPSAAPQYYPVLHTLFWIEYKLWHDWPLPYHLVTIALHALAALLLVKLVRRLELPGAWFAAAIFALHPVHVESVAWFSEVKNTLSTVFALAAAIVFFRFAQDRHRHCYAAALLLFAFACLTKTVVVTLPVVFLVVLWWKNGAINWRRDVVPLIPFFAIALVAGAITVWTEQKFCAEQGEQFNYSVIDRTFIAGRLFWFYLTNLAGPTNLTLIYPAWKISARDCVYPIAAIALFGALWLRRKQTRGPFAAFLSFAIMLWPVLGFINLSYYMSNIGNASKAAVFRADHFQYLADIAIIIFFAVAVGSVARRCRSSLQPALHAAAVLLLLACAGLTNAHARDFRDAESCFRDVLGKNPNSATAHTNLANALMQRGAIDEAIAHFEKAISLQPDLKMGEFNLGNALLQRGKIDIAISHLQRALTAQPDYVKARAALVSAYGTRGNRALESNDLAAATREYREAIAVDPNNATAHYNLALALMRAGDAKNAADELRTVLRLQPNYPDAEELLRQLEK